MQIANGRPLHSLRYGLLVAVSMLALSGCVSAVTDEQELAAATATQATEPKATADAAAPSEHAAKSAQAGKDYVDPMVSAAGQAGSNPPQQASTGSAQVYGDKPEISGLVTQTTSISAGNTSIYANPGEPVAVQPPGDAAQAETATIPAYVPVPGINPALSSVYSAAPQASQPSVSQPAVAPQEQSSNIAPQAAQPVVADIPAKTEGDGSSDKQGISLAAFFAGAAKKRIAKEPGAAPSAPQEVAALPQTADTDAMGIALKGRATMSDEFDDAHIDEDDEPVGLMKLASLSGLSRIAPNGLFLQTDKVNVGCFKPELVKVIKDIEGYYHRPAIITSGYRPPKGVRQGSKHYTCDAADIQVEGVSKWELANYLRSLPNRGGVGTYCHTESVHVDTGEARDWNWRCRRTTAKKS